MFTNLLNVAFAVVATSLMLKYADATIFEALTVGLLALCAYTLSDISRAVRKK